MEVKKEISCNECSNWGPRDMNAKTWKRESAVLGRCGVFEQNGRFSSMRRGDVKACEKFVSEL